VKFEVQNKANLRKPTAIRRVECAKQSQFRLRRTGRGPGDVGRGRVQTNPIYRAARLEACPFPRPSPLPDRLCETKPNLGRMGHLGDGSPGRGQSCETNPISGAAGVGSPIPVFVQNEPNLPGGAGRDGAWGTWDDGQIVQDKANCPRRGTEAVSAPGRRDGSGTCHCERSAAICPRCAAALRAPYPGRAPDSPWISI
jgi:hypothetical protein